MAAGAGALCMVPVWAGTNPAASGSGGGASKNFES